LLRRANSALEAPAPGADPEFDRLLGDHKWAGDPLYLMMAGLAAAKSGTRQALSLSRTDLALTIGRNELNRIGRIGAARGVDEKVRFPGAFVRHMAAIATLLQGLTVGEARRLTAQEIEALKSSADIDATVDTLMDALPMSDILGGVAPILPDIVGEGAILAWFGRNGGLSTSGVDPEARIAAAARTAVAKASATLVRTAQDFASAGYAEPVQWLSAVAGAPETDLGALMEIADALPQNTIALRETAAALHLRIADIIRSVTERERRNEFGDQLQSIFALSLNSLGNRLSELGRREDARAAAQEANGIYRRLAAARPDAFLPNLALSLNNLGNRLSELRRREDALAAAQEAMTTLAPYFLKSPQAYAQWMSVMARGYSERCEESGVEPDPILLGPIAEGLRKLQAKPDAEPASDA
jgi:hypothetical protein